MLKQTCSDRSDMEILKKPKSKEKIELKFVIQQKQVKAKLPAENADIWLLQQTFSRHIQKAFITFLSFFKLLSMCACFKSINTSSLSRKKYNAVNFTPTPVRDYDVKIRQWK